jgi:1,4-dihydroxy-2-naphthoyl-CoA synthase
LAPQCSDRRLSQKDRRKHGEIDLSYQTILVVEEGDVRTITLNRPERRNAMTPEIRLQGVAALSFSEVPARRFAQAWI